MARKLSGAEREEMKARRLSLIKDRYRQLILEPRRQIEMEMFADAPQEDVEFDLAD